MSEEVVVSVQRVLLVGELNPYGGDPRFALYHLPRKASGNRLRIILGLTDVSYLRLCSRVNLCTGRWSMEQARIAAMDLLEHSTCSVFVLCGAKVRDAFGGVQFFTSWKVGEKTIVVIPHPSGRCLLWNAPGSMERARNLLRDVAPEVPWGEGVDFVRSGG